jgi:hypothetical protein
MASPQEAHYWSRLFWISFWNRVEANCMIFWQSNNTCENQLAHYQESMHKKWELVRKFWSMKEIWYFQNILSHFLLYIVTSMIPQPLHVRLTIPYFFHDPICNVAEYHLCLTCKIFLLSTGSLFPSLLDASSIPL